MPLCKSSRSTTLHPQLSMADTEDRPTKRIKLANHDASEDEQTQRELRAGITHYVNPNTPGFNGILKQR